MNARRVLSRLGIQVVEEVRGELWAHCPDPAHDDRAPSWSLNAKSGKHHCLSCGFRGNLYTLAAKLLGFDREWDGGAQSVADWLAGEEDKAPKEELRPGFEVQRAPIGSLPFRLPPGVTVAPVSSWPAPPREYVLGVRGIPEAQADRWGLGYSSAGRLAGRVVVVVRDSLGGPASYMARDFLERPDVQRYLYPMREERPDLDVMFGERWWPPARADRRVVLVGEGALKALALERASGGLPVAALGGSRLRPIHALKLQTFGRVVYVRDEGKAGFEAWLGVRASLGRHVDLSLVELPDGEDADGLDRSDPERLRRILRSALFHS